MVYGFFDESGKLADRDFICLCGYVSDEDKWNRFGTQWDLLLRRHEIPEIHIAPLLARQEPFRNIDWKEEHEREVLRQFAKVARDNTLAYFGVAVDAKYYRTMHVSARRLFGQKQALDFAFQRLLRLIMDLKAKWPDETTFHLWFDYTEDFSQICLKSLARLRRQKTEIRNALKAITFADRKEFYPLQAADMLAYATNADLRSSAPDYYATLTGGTEDDPGPRPFSEFYNGEELENLLRKIKAGEIAPL